MKSKATAKKGWNFHYLWVLCILRVELQLFKICFEYLSTSIFAHYCFQGPEIFVVESSCADFAIPSVIGGPFTEGLFVDW